MKQSKLQQSGTDNSAPKGGEKRPPSPQGKPGEALGAYAEKWNRDPADNFATHCIKENTLDELQTDHLPENADELDCEQWGLSPEEWSDAIKTAIAEKRIETQKQEKGTSEKNGNRDQKKDEPGVDLLTEFQTVEWNAVTLAATEMDEAEKQEKLGAMMSRLTEVGNKLKQESLKSFGISPITVDTRIAMAGRLVDDILKSDKRYSIRPEQGADRNAAQSAMRNFEASEWQMLEQGTKAKNAAKTPDVERREKEQEKLFKSAHQYFGASGGLACDCESLGIPKEIVQMRAEQRLKHMGDDPDLSQMRNPSRDAYRLSGAAVFAAYIKEMIEKLAKTIKRLVAQSKASHTPTTAAPPKTQSSEASGEGRPLSSETAAPAQPSETSESAGPRSRAGEVAAVKESNTPPSPSRS